MATVIHARRPFLAGDIDTGSARIVSSQPNFLSLEQRPLHPTFDIDGPGYLSVDGPRHDNDHINIRDIQILPTADEILAVERPPWMPKKNVAEPHFLAPGPLRLFDTLFRHLRYDSVESIRDVCYHASQFLTLVQATCNDEDLDVQLGQTRQETPDGNRYFIYHDARIEELLAHEHKGLLVRVSYNCPPHMRGRQMHSSDRFEEGMLCALIGLDHDNESLSVTFFAVHLSQSTHSIRQERSGHANRAAIQLCFVRSAKFQDVHGILRYAREIATAQFVLVEFPKVLYEGFYHTLKRLQEMESEDVAFSHYLAPRMRIAQIQASIANTLAGIRQQYSILPPAYAQLPNHNFNMSCLSTAGTQTSSVGHDLSLQYLNQHTSLDDGQARALCDALQREMSYTSGPPGTGKTYLGIAIAQTILASRSEKKKPILAVCLTNHALDNFLDGLKAAGLTSLVRIGNGSKEDWTEDINLRIISRERKYRGDRLDLFRKNAAFKYREDLYAEEEALCREFNSNKKNGEVGWHTIKRVLQVSVSSERLSSLPRTVRVNVRWN